MKPVSEDSGVASAYRDAEGWVLFDAAGEPVAWPESWPTEIDAQFLSDRGIEIGA